MVAPCHEIVERSFQIGMGRETLCQDDGVLYTHRRALSQCRRSRMGRITY